MYSPSLALQDLDKKFGHFLTLLANWFAWTEKQRSALDEQSKILEEKVAAKQKMKPLISDASVSKEIPSELTGLLLLIEKINQHDGRMPPSWEAWEQTWENVRPKLLKFTKELTDRD